VEPVIHKKIPVPENVEAILSKEKRSTFMQADFEELKEFLLQR
jgi:hypothetical protein